MSVIISYYMFPVIWCDIKENVTTRHIWSQSVIFFELSLLAAIFKMTWKTYSSLGVAKDIYIFSKEEV